ncbi:MAG: ECF-type sigma factor [Acidobacteriota bacterium]|nr:ECF-type sigma factor [Acidobacteriota bacterium]
MPDSTPSRFSILLVEARQGNHDAHAELIQLVYQDLRRLAQNYLNRERPSPSLQATALVHDVYVRLFGESLMDWQTRSHFLIVAATQMRRLLIDHARAAATTKRDGRGRSVPLEEAAALPLANTPDLVALDDALQDLEKLRPRACQVVELRFFGGLTEDEAARVLEVSATTVKREWKWAKAWLYDQMCSPE